MQASTDAKWLCMRTRVLIGARGVVSPYEALGAGKAGAARGGVVGGLRPARLQRHPEAGSSWPSWPRDDVGA